MQKDKLIRCLPVSLSFRLLQTTTSHIITVCKLFSCNAKQHMPFLASKRYLIDLQQVLFQRVTNALLESNQAPFRGDLITDGLVAGCGLAFCTYSFYLQMVCLKLCNVFSKPYLCLQRIKLKRLLYRRRMIE